MKRLLRICRMRWLLDPPIFHAWPHPYQPVRRRDEHRTHRPTPQGSCGPCRRLHPILVRLLQHRLVHYGNMTASLEKWSLCSGGNHSDIRGRRRLSTVSKEIRRCRSIACSMSAEPAAVTRLCSASDYVRSRNCLVRTARSGPIAPAMNPAICNSPVFERIENALWRWIVAEGTEMNELLHG